MSSSLSAAKKTITTYIVTKSKVVQRQRVVKRKAMRYFSESEFFSKNPRQKNKAPAKTVSYDNNNHKEDHRTKNNNATHDIDRIHVSQNSHAIISSPS